MAKTITLTDLKVKEILITKDPRLSVNLLFRRIDDTGKVFDTKRIILTEDDFTETQVNKFTDILSAIVAKAKSKEL